MPTRQLTARPPAAGTRTAVLRRPTAWLYESAALERRVLELSYGTRLPVVSVADDAVEVARPGGVRGWLRRTAVALRADGAAWPAFSGARLVAQARRLIGLQYLWGGTSGFCYDCSGLTHAVCRALGTTIPRDAADQARAGARVATRGALRPGDLVFFRSASGAIHHVGLYAGSGKMIHAPRTGSSVQTVSLAAEPYAREFAGGRRFTP
jgi:cell wall-associated NlpC family hydrolase